MLMKKIARQNKTKFQQNDLMAIVNTLALAICVNSLLPTKDFFNCTIKLHIKHLLID